jgi:hypothetical protein
MSGHGEAHRERKERGKGGERRARLGAELGAWGEL